MITLFAVALFAAQTSPELEVRLSQTYKTCMDASGGVTVEMLNCIAEETRQQDARLNTVYRQLRDAGPADERDALRDAQRAWIRARDARCESRRADAGDGTLSSVVFADCYLTETARRVIWLENREE